MRAVEKGRGLTSAGLAASVLSLQGVTLLLLKSQGGRGLARSSSELSLSERPYSDVILAGETCDNQIDTYLFTERTLV